MRPKRSSAPSAKMARPVKLIDPANSLANRLRYPVPYKSNRAHLFGRSSEITGLHIQVRWRATGEMPPGKGLCFAQVLFVLPSWWVDASSQVIVSPGRRRSTGVAWDSITTGARLPTGSVWRQGPSTMGQRSSHLGDDDG